MGKGHRHQKNLKSEKAKVKLKTKTKNLPKGLNVTDTSFKVKKILIREQLKTQNDNEIVSRKNLNIKELTTRLHHYNSSVRQEAVKGLKDILSQYSSSILSSQLHSLLQGIAALSLDKERSVRRDALKALTMILKPVSNDRLEPFFDIVISYLSCAMTHIDPRIKEDSLLFLDVLAENCGSLLAVNSHKILPNFLDMISKLRTESRLDRQLTTSLNSKQTSIKWRINVLTRLSNILTSMINVKKFKKHNDDNSGNGLTNVTRDTFHVPLFKINHLKVRQINFAKGKEFDIEIGNNAELKELKEFIQVLMPLMIESWIEVAPKKQGENAQSNLVIGNEASSLLNTVMKIMELLVEYVDIFETEWGIRTVGIWFNDQFRTAFEKSILENFPYCETRVSDKFRKRQEDFTSADVNAKCLEQNLAISHIYIWLSCRNFTNGCSSRSAEEKSSRVLQYLSERLEDWSGADNSALPQLTRCLKCLLLTASKIWYRNKIPLGIILQNLIDVHLRPSKKELRARLFPILTKIVMDHDLSELHCEPAFKEFIASLPNFLLKHSIHEETINMLNRVVLQHRKWVENSLRNKYDDIIENAKKIEIIGSGDEKRSRLSICNLFYFVDGQVYY